MTLLRPLIIAIVALASGSSLIARPLADDSDRAAFRAWFTFLADSQFQQRAPDVTDCAALVRYAYREALRAHTPAWYRAQHLPVAVSIPDVRTPPPIRDGAWRLFRVSDRPERYAEFADATTLMRHNARLLSRDAATAAPGDLLYFRQDDADSPAHLMVFVGESRYEPTGRDWLVYHTGPDGDSPGEVRKVSLADLRRHPSPRWRPIAANPAFIGVFRLTMLDRER
mgnify:CR=1 FL=1